MGEIRRKAPPAGRPPEQPPFPRFGSYEFVQPAAGAALIPFRYGREAPVEPLPILFPRFSSYTHVPLAVNVLIPVRTGQWLGDELPRLVARPAYFAFPFPAGEAARPVIPPRVGRDVLAGPEAFVPSRHLPFPYFEQPAKPVIPPRVGQDVLARSEAFVPPHHFPFPYVEQPAHPVVGFRYGQDVLERLAAFVSPQYHRFPYFEQPANGLIPLRRGQDILARPEAFVAPAYHRFPYFEQPAQPGIRWRSGQWLGDRLPDDIRYPRFVDASVSILAAAPSPALISFRLGRWPNDQPEAFPFYGPHYSGYAFDNLLGFPLIPFRRGQWLGERPDETVWSGYGPAAQTLVELAAAKPGIAFRLGQWLGDAPPHDVRYPRHLGYSIVETAPGPASPVIRFRMRPLFEQRDPEIGRFSQYSLGYFVPTTTRIHIDGPLRGPWIGLLPLPTGASRYRDYVYNELPSPASPVIPIRLGQWRGDQIEPLVGGPAHQRFPVFAFPVAPANPVPFLLTRRLEELAGDVKLVEPRYILFTPFHAIIVIPSISGPTLEACAQPTGAATNESCAPPSSNPTGEACSPPTGSPGIEACNQPTTDKTLEACDPPITGPTGTC